MSTIDIAWLSLARRIIESGSDLGDIIELLNTITIIDDFRFNSQFDYNFRKIFGDDRIDTAQKYTFDHPKIGLVGYNYIINGKWSDSYYNRMIRYRDKCNQIENAITILKQNKNTKRCEIIVYDPEIDMKNIYKQPCLIAIDIKPRKDLIYLTAMFRSQAISKSAYADFTALVKLGQFLAKESFKILKSITVLSCSSHVRKQNKEKTKTLTLLKEMKDE